MHKYRRFSRPFPRIDLLVCGLVLALASFPAQSTSKPDGMSVASTDALVEQTWHQNGLQALCDAMVSNILDSVRHHPDLTGTSAHRRNRLLAAYQKHATTSRFERRMKKYLANTPRRALLAMNQLSQSAIGQLAMQEERRFKAASPMTLMTYWRQLRNQPDGDQRIAVIKRLDLALGVTDIALSVAGASLYGARAALGTSNAVKRTEDTRASDRQLSALVDAFVNKMRPAQQQQVELTYLYLYRNLSLADLTEYVGRYEQEPVRSLQRQLVQALGTEMIAIQSDVIRELTQPAPAVNGTNI